MSSSMAIDPAEATVDGRTVVNVRIEGNPPLSGKYSG